MKKCIFYLGQRRCWRSRSCSRKKRGGDHLFNWFILKKKISLQINLDPAASLKRTSSLSPSSLPLGSAAPNTIDNVFLLTLIFFAFSLDELSCSSLNPTCEDDIPSGPSLSEVYRLSKNHCLIGRRSCYILHGQTAIEQLSFNSV